MMWRKESGFLEMFLAYFNECEADHRGQKTYRDFLFDILSQYDHLRNGHKQKSGNTARNEESAKPETTKIESEASPKEAKQSASGSCDTNAGEKKSESPSDDRMLLPHIKQEAQTDVGMVILPSEPDPPTSCPTSTLSSVAAHYSQPTGSPSPADSESQDTLIPCYSCANWFSPSAIGSHPCVPIRLDIEDSCPDSRLFNFPLDMNPTMSQPSPSRPKAMVRTYSCRTCDKPFICKYKRDRHERTHTGERPFACNLCPKRFTRQEHQRRHLKAVHQIGTGLFDDKAVTMVTPESLSLPLSLPFQVPPMQLPECDLRTLGQMQMGGVDCDPRSMTHSLSASMPPNLPVSMPGFDPRVPPPGAIYSGGVTTPNNLQ